MPLVITGVVYAVMAYGLESDDPFAAVNHPWQPLVLHLHLLAAPAWLIVLGVLWSTHAQPRLRLRSPQRRRTGLLVLTLALPMLASGYLLQTSVDEAWRTAWRWLHVGSSVVWLLAWLAHVLQRRPTPVPPVAETTAFAASGADASARASGAATLAVPSTVSGCVEQPS